MNFPVPLVVSVALGHIFDYDTYKMEIIIF